MSELLFPPSMVMIAGALILLFLRGNAFKAVSLIVPLATLAAVWMTTDKSMQVPWLDYQLIVTHKSPPTMIFATIFSIMAFGGALFSLNMERYAETPAAFVYAGSAIGVTFSGDLFTLFVWWELMAVGSVVLLWSSRFRHDPDGVFSQRARDAALRYAFVHFVGGAIFMSGLAAHVVETGSTALTNLSALDSWGSVLILTGILINAAAPPLGSWLADAYPEASESGTVWESAYTTKTSVYVLMILFAGTDLLIYVGSAMAVYGIVMAILENDMRRILAYSIVNQVGFMVCAVGIGTPLAINGAAAHAFAHIIYKALLLMSAGSVLYQTGKRKCTDLGGLYRTMPITMWAGIIGALAISAFPGTSGFTTKSMITSAAAYEHMTMAWFILMAASAGVFLHAGIKFPWFVFFQKDSGMRPPDPPWNMRAAMLLFSAFCIVLGLYPAPLYAILPFPMEEALHTNYEAYTLGHVIQQLQLLLFSGLAFFVLLPMLKRTETITLDFDWAYRRFVPWIWDNMLSPLLVAMEPIRDGILQGIPQSMAETFGEGGKVDKGVPHSWGTSTTVLVITVFLFLFLLVNLAV